MRPINLKISAFGPYADTVEIPMDKLGDKGIYLITGDTGAGKTSIFDAIAFALYGEASGNIRTTELFRCKHALPETPTFVELTFLLRGKEYTVRRNPSYMRPAKRGGEKLTEETAKADLICPDGRTYSGVSSVNNAIKELIGLDKSQFSQIAMIAQGDFYKLLMADTKERSEIYRKIFGTQPYLDFQYRLKSDLKALEEKRSAAVNSIKQYINDLSCDTASAYFDTLNTYKKDENLGTLSSLLKLTDTIIQSDKEILSLTDSNLKAKENVISALDVAIGRLEQIEQLNAELTGLKDIHPRLQEKLLNAESQYNEQKANIPVREQLAVDIQTMNKELDKYKEYENGCKRLETLCGNIELLTSRVEKLSLEIAHEQRALTAYKTEQESLRNIGIDCERCKTRGAEIDSQIASIKDVLILVKDYKTMYNNFIKARKNYNSAADKYNEIQTLCLNMEQAYYDGQAGVLAQRLEEGKPCPVCGSTTHPARAVLPEDIPTKATLDKHKSILEEQSKIRSELSSLAGQANGSALTAWDNMLKSFFALPVNEQTEPLVNELKTCIYQELDTDNIISYTNGIDEHCMQILELKETEKSANIIESKELLNKAARLETLTDTIARLEESHSTKSETLGELQKNLAMTGIEQAEVKKQLAKLKEALVWDTKEAALADINAKILKKQQLDETYNNVKNVYDSLVIEETTTRQRITDTESRLNTIKSGLKEQQLDNTSDLKELSALRFQSETERKALSDKVGELTFRIRTNTNAYNSIINVNSSLEDILKRYTMVKSLCDTANGSVSGKDRIMFETYVQMTHFDRIIERANIRLYTMTNGDYQLVRTKNAENQRSQAGLDLSVVYKNTTRSVRSVSGGETFMASLSLALGLSDEVQSRAGGISIDTMFIDEGFGSLDDGVLNNAINALVELSGSNRLIGIISHVNELKERIDKQIVVTKDINGSSNATIIH